VGGRKYLIHGTLSPKKSDWTRMVGRKYLNGATPSSKTLIGRECETESTWLVELPAPRNLIGRQRNTKIMWLTELPGRKTPDSTRVGDRKHLIGWIPSPSKPNCPSSQPLETWLAGFPAPRHVIGWTVSSSKLDSLNSEPSQNVIGWTPSSPKSD
jgi:hypothetical protein